MYRPSPGTHQASQVPDASLHTHRPDVLRDATRSVDPGRPSESSPKRSLCVRVWYRYTIAAIPSEPSVQVPVSREKPHSARRQWAEGELSTVIVSTDPWPRRAHASQHSPHRSLPSKQGMWDRARSPMRLTQARGATRYCGSNHYRVSQVPMPFSMARLRIRGAVAMSSIARPRLAVIVRSLGVARPGFFPATSSPRSA